MGLGIGGSQTTEKDVEASQAVHGFIGLQTTYYMTFEGSLTEIKFSKLPGPPDKTQDKTFLMLSGSMLLHLPISDSSIFVGLGASRYSYSDEHQQTQDVDMAMYRAGIDLGIKPTITLRLEWMRHVKMKYNKYEFDTDSVILGLYKYF